MKIYLRTGFAVGAAVGLLLAFGAYAYERELTAREIREAVFLGKDKTFRSEEFFEGYVRTFPVPDEGPHISRIEVVTPFKAIVDRARQAPGDYNPVEAQADYKEQPPPVVVTVRLELTPTYPAHSPYHVPLHLGPIYVRDPDFWQEFRYSVAQRGELSPASLVGTPLYLCGGDSAPGLLTTTPAPGTCWLAGADVTLVLDPEDVASRPLRVTVVAPEGGQVEAEFDLGKLR